MEAARKAKLGQRWMCFKCNGKFYDLNKPQPICPKCQTDQHESPEFQKPAKKRGQKKAAVRKEAPPVEEIEEAPPRAAAADEETEEDYGGAAEEADFDDLDDLEIDDAGDGEDENVSLEVEED